MDSKILSAGSYRISRQILFTFLILSSLFSCRQEKQQKDPQMDQLRKDVKQLSDENQRLLKELQNLREELKQQTQPVVKETKPVVRQEMTMQQMKVEVEPVLKEAIIRIKKTAETPRKDKQYGMRIEYDLANAVYGLQNNEGYPPSAKVIVKYEKFLESDKDSRSYGTGSSTFIFAYQNKQWILQSYE
jgi:septal ring factor EnvC (AmiA/AmiB activator)